MPPTSTLQRQLNAAETIKLLVNQRRSREAVALFQFRQHTLLHRSEFEFLLSAVLRALGRCAAAKQAQQVHSVLLTHGFISRSSTTGRNQIVLITSLLDMYCKCRRIEEARRVFSDMPRRDVVSSNTMISGLCDSGMRFDAMKLFDDMPQRDIGSWNSIIRGLGHGQVAEKWSSLIFFKELRKKDVELDLITIVTVLSICANLGAAMIVGKQTHSLATKYGFQHYIPVGNALIDMYAKCGCIEHANLCFENMSSKNVISWTSLIMGYGRHGLASKALDVFHQMEPHGVKPNRHTFLAALYACSQSGLVQEGWRIFDAMRFNYTLTPFMEHYTCMVDLLSRAGQLKEALDFIERKMTVQPDAKLLTALFSSCCLQKNINLARTVADKLLQLQPEEAGAYMLLSNFYSLTGDKANVVNVRRLMLNKGIRKEKASTWIEVNGEYHSFESGDRSHAASKEIYGYLCNIVRRASQLGYVPHTSSVMQNVDEQLELEILLGHSEKLAIAFGVISTPPWNRIVIFKNLRVCVDCHLLTSFISKLEGRDIIARDSTRFHHFKDGECSCRNKW